MRMWRSVLAVMVLTVGVLFITTAAAVATEPVVPYDTPDAPGSGNADCLHCHQDATHMAASTRTQSFSWQSTPVNYANCKKCHTAGLAGSHPFHNVGLACGGCHPGWGSTLYSAIPGFVNATSGSFAASSSLTVGSDALHQIHMAPRWAATADTKNSRCASCHQKAACGTCHGDASSNLTLPSLHGAHPAQSNMTTSFAFGIVSSHTEYTAAPRTEACYGAGCHDVAGQNTSGPLPAEGHLSGHSSNAGLTFFPSAPGGGVWRESYRSSFTQGRMTYSGTSGAYVDFAFSGEQVELIGDLDPYRGRAEIFIDPTGTPVPVATIDLYNTTTKTQVKLFSSNALASGSHVLRVRVTGLKRAEARAAFVSVDQFKVRAEAAGKFNPTCWSCHASYTSAHATGTVATQFTHEASVSAGATWRMAVGYPTLRCDDCHDMTMATVLPNEHKRTTSNTQSQTCEPCHSSATGPLVPMSWSGNYNYTCGYTNPSNGRGCHANGTGQHTFFDANHNVLSDVADTSGKVCRGCHIGDLAVIHNNSITSNDTTGSMIVSNCLSCHSDTQYPTTKSCVALGCHAFNSFNDHPDRPTQHDAAATQPAATNTGGFSCLTCHDDLATPTKMNLQPEHLKASTMGGAVTCLGCHDKTYFPKPWDTAGGADDRNCDDCHAATKAANPIHGDYTAEHTPDAPSVTACGTGTGCHAGEMGVMHVNSVVGNTMNATCRTCHTNNTAVPAVKSSCTAAGCHPSYTHGTEGTAGGYHKTGAAWTTCNAGCHAKGTSLIPLHNNNCNTCHNNPTRDAANPNLTWNAGVQLATSNCTDARCHSGYNVSDGTASHSGQTGIDASHTASAITASSKAFGGSKDTTGTLCTSYCHVTTMGGANLGTKGEHDATYDAVDVSSDGRVTCVECHTSSEYSTSHDEFQTGKNCSACHSNWVASSGTHGGTQHNFTTQAANQTCWDGCHGGATQPTFKTRVTVTTGPTNVAELHANAVIVVGPTTYRSCNVCHRDGGRVVGISSGRVGPDLCSDCHPDHGTSWNHVSTASTYSDVTQTGCTGSGAGCHNTSNDVGFIHTGTTFAGGCSQFTPNTCHNITGVAGTNSPYSSKVGGNQECTACHNYTVYPDTPNANPLLGIWPNGHYKETTHTAVSMTTSLTISGGTASARCQDCHKSFSGNPQGLYGMHQAVPANNYGPNITCRECHTDPSALTGMNSANVVKTNWSSGSKQCANCHTVTSSAPMGHAASLPAATATSPLSCGGSSGAGATPGCHNSYNLHQLHNKAATGTAGCSLSDSANGGGSCHNLTAQVVKPTSKTCGGATAACHKTHLTPTNANGNHATVNATSDPTSLHSASATFTTTIVSRTGASYSKNCSSCHSQWLGTEHATLKTVGSYGSGGVLCFECHNSTASLGTNNPNAVVWNNWNSGAKQCQNCHALNTSHASGNSSTTAGMHMISESYTVRNPDGCEVSADCHVGFSDNIAYYHSEADTTSAGGLNSCNVCHNGADGMQFGRVKTTGSEPLVWDCVDCHGEWDFHLITHDADYNGYYKGITYDTGRNVGCFNGCHYTVLNNEHAPTANRTMNGAKGSDVNWCTVCHTNADRSFGGHTGGAYAGSAAVRAAIANADRRCVSCHNQEGPDNSSPTTGGVEAPHRNGYAAGADGANIRPTTLTTAPNSLLLEFGDWSAKTTKVGGGHNSVAGLTYPYTTGWTWSATMKAGWTGGGTIQNQKVLCSDCHQGTGGTGPQGASVPYGLLNYTAVGASTITRHNTNGTAYTGNPTNSTQALAGDWYNGTGPYFLPDGNSTAGNLTVSAHNSAIVAPGLCNKCHSTLSGPYHGGNGGHNFPYKIATGQYLYSPPCISCHIKIPHAWKRPRLLRRNVATTNTGVPVAYRPADGLPYSDSSQTWADSIGVAHTGFRGPGFTGITGSGGCNENLCEKHGTTGTDLWP